MENTELLKPLTKEQEDASLADVGYTREQLKADLQQIKVWLAGQEHLPPSRLKEGDSFFEHYLIACKRSLEKVKRKLDCYYTIRTFSEVFDSRDPTEASYKNMNKMCDLAILPEATADGTHLLIGTFVDTESDKFSHLGYGRRFINLLDIFARMGGLSAKIYMIWNCKGLTAEGVLKMVPTVTRDLTVMMQDGLPFRYVKIVATNVPKYLEFPINNIVKPLLSKKLRERYLIFSSGNDDHLNYFSPNMLPRDYGGVSTNPSLKEYSDRWLKYEEENRHWFLNELSEKNDESKRVSVDHMVQNPLFGVHGSLKKLVID